MKKYLSALVALAVLMGLLLTGCECKHQWQDATCNTPKTCEKCGVTEGDVLTHMWADATTDAPKTCTLCGLTEGEKIVTDSRFTTSACKDLIGTWEGIISLNGEEIDVPTFAGTLDLTYTLVFGNDGYYSQEIVLKDKPAFLKKMQEHFAEEMYAQYEAQGLTREQADEKARLSLGFDIMSYSLIMADSVDWSAVYTAEFPEGVYYVADGRLYYGEDWESEMASESFTRNGETLQLESLTAVFPDLTFSPVAE